jgi:uncharacterized protein (DUF1501 family)
VRCIECEEIELARVSDARPSQIVPVPYAALDGFPAGRSPRDLTRRRLLQWGVAGMASIYGAKELGWETIWESVADAADAPMEKALVLLYLAGGNDGLNVLVPNETADYTSYQAARPMIHRAKGDNTDTRIGSRALKGPGGAALRFANVVVAGDNGDPNFGLDKLYGDGVPEGLGLEGSDLAIMPAVDAKQYNLSHFDNSDIWFRASNDLNVKTGWLGRWIDRNGNGENPLQAISIDTALSKAIRASKNPVCAINALPMPGFTMNSQNYGGSNSYDVNPHVNGLTGSAAGPDNAYLARSRATYGLAVQTRNALLQGPAYVPGTGYPGTATHPLSRKLQTAAHLLAANLGTRVITIHWGAFDTHTGQLASQDRQLTDLSRALGAFKADLMARGIEDKVCTLVFSEFGRRVRENGSGTEAGTDHGAGGLMMAMGSGVRGGFAADWPGCETSERVPANENQGNLKVPTDYRSVYMAVIEEWLGDENPQSLIGGPPVERLVRGDGYTGTRILFK